MSKLSIFEHSPEDELTYLKWRRGVFIFYACLGLVAAGGILVTHVSRLAFEFAGN
jgi:hypothetical protein